MRQPYPREKGGLVAANRLFPKLKPSLSDEDLKKATQIAFGRTLSDRVGAKRKLISTPEDLVKKCINHLMTRSGPIIGTYFYSECDIEDIFILDAIPHEMQRRRMDIGLFYQYLVVELMRFASVSKATHIEGVFDGTREGDVVADVKTPGLKAGLRIYGSVKKSSDTVGGQDVPGVIRRLESVAKAEKNITRPYICALIFATPTKGKIYDYQNSRKVRKSQEGYPYSENCEAWGPGFIYPYISGRSCLDIYKLSVSMIANYLPFYSLQYQKQCTALLTKKLKSLKLIGKNGKIDQKAFINFVSKEQ